MTIKCHEYFGCKKKECAIFNGKEDENCWELEPSSTPCIDSISKLISVEEKLVFCKNCLYYEHVNNP
jgi:hypothetical protein